MFGQGGSGGGFGNVDLSKVNPMAIVVIAMIIFSGMLTMVGDTYTFQKPAVEISQKILTIPVFIFYKMTQDRVSADALTGAIYLAILCSLGFWAWRLIKFKVLEPMQMKDLAQETDRKEKLINTYRER